MNRYLKSAFLVALAAICSLPQLALADLITVTLNGEYRYTGNAPSPTPFFSFSFEVERSPTVCGGSTGAFIACGASSGHYVNGTLDTLLGTSEAPTVLFRDAANGGGFAFFQQDLPLNRLSFTVGSSQLFSGTLGSPTLMDGVYSITLNPPCSPFFGCNYASYAGQGFASGDPINNPFQDPESLQSYDPLIAGTITIGPTISSVPEPSSYSILLAGLCIIAMQRFRRIRNSTADFA